MHERRKHRRNRTRFPAVVLDGESGRFVGYVGNITPEGIMIVSDNPIEAGAEYAFRIELPDEVRGRKQFAFRACCLWCQATADSCTYRSGYELLQLTADDLDLVRQIIEDETFLWLVS
jgi:hypothetical protein